MCVLHVIHEPIRKGVMLSVPSEIIYLRTFYKNAAAVAIGDEYITLALIKTVPEEFVLSNIRGRVQMGKIHTAQDTVSSLKEAEQDFDKRCRDALSAGYRPYYPGVHRRARVFPIQVLSKFRCT